MIEFTKPERGVVIYPSVDVRLTYQNFGSTWLCILRGSSENIDLVFNGLYNWKGTNGDYQFHDHVQTVAVFWSDRRALRRFFFNRYFVPRSDGGKRKRCTNQGRLIRNAMRYAHSQIQALRDNGHEFFMDHSRQYMPQVHGMGQINAERPDSDFKDSVLGYAFADKSE